MTTSCQKDYSLTVGSGGVANMMYWTFEQPTGPIHDSSIGVSMDIINCPLVAGYIGNAREFNPGGGDDPFVGCQLNADLSHAASPQLGDYAGGGVTHAFWIKMNAHSGGFPVAIVATTLNGNDGHQYQFDLRIGLGGVDDNPTFNLIQDPSTLGPTVLSVTVPIAWVLGRWYFVVLVYDQTTGKFKVYINASLQGTSAGVYMLPNGPWVSINMAGVLLYPTVDLDEYLVHTEKAFTANHVLGLWNCENGVTWPAAGAVAAAANPPPPTCTCAQFDAATVAAINAAYGTTWDGKINGTWGSGGGLLFDCPQFSVGGIAYISFFDKTRLIGPCNPQVTTFTEPNNPYQVWTWANFFPGCPVADSGAPATFTLSKC